MQVLVLANEMQQEELAALPVSDNITLKYLDHPTNTAIDSAPDVCIDLLFENSEERIKWLKRLNTSLVIVNSVNNTLHDIGENFIRINGWSSFLARPVVEAAGNDEVLEGKAEGLFSLLGRKTEWVPDTIGFVTPRVISCIINEAFFALEEKVSTESEIDTAMKLGTNYPYGPFEWGERIGWEKIYSLLLRLAAQQGRYQPCQLLQMKALA